MNRVVARGIKLPLEVFKTEHKGWGVRCVVDIPVGSFVCDYAGLILTDSEAVSAAGCLTAALSAITLGSSWLTARQ